MADNELEIAGLRDDYYRDSFGRLVFIMAGMVFAIALLLATSFYLYLSEPPPVTFSVYKEWRVQPDVPLDQPYLARPELLQWVSDTLRKVFHFDFIHYNHQLNEALSYFTNDGKQVLQDQLKIYANADDIQTNKMFINSTPESAPVIAPTVTSPEGILSGRYAWWVQVPITIDYIGNNGHSSKTLTLQVLVVRVPTLNNLMGVAIDNLIVVQPGVKAGG